MRSVLPVQKSSNKWSSAPRKSPKTATRKDTSSTLKKLRTGPLKRAQAAEKAAAAAKPVVAPVAAASKAVQAPAAAPVIIKALENGPYLVGGGAMVTDHTGKVLKVGTFALCACGKTQNGPFCDGSHSKKPAAGPRDPGSLAEEPTASPIKLAGKIAIEKSGFSDPVAQKIIAALSEPAQELLDRAVPADAADKSEDGGAR